MDIEQAIETIYTGLVSEESVPVKLRAFRELDREMLGQVQEALSFAIEYRILSNIVMVFVYFQWKFYKIF